MSIRGFWARNKAFLLVVAAILLLVSLFTLSAVYLGTGDGGAGIGLIESGR